MFRVNKRKKKTQEVSAKEKYSVFTDIDSKNIVSDKLIEIDRDQVLEKYKNAKESNDIATVELLEDLCGQDVFAPLYNVIYRIKTFEDAYNELKARDKSNPNILLYDKLVIYDDENSLTQLKRTKDNKRNYRDIIPGVEDLIAYLKLRIVVCALNESWEPLFLNNEERYWPWFKLYTLEEYNKISEEDREKLNVRTLDNYYTVDIHAIAYDSTGDSDFVGDLNKGFNSPCKLCFRTKELCEYSWKQFSDLWLDYLFAPLVDEDDSPKEFGKLKQNKKIK